MYHLKRFSEYLSQCGWFAYLTMVLLQLAVVWRAWDYRDFTTGDTTSYYHSALLWFHHHQCNFAWSPLYTSFFGAFLFISNSAYFAVMGHRLVIVLALAMLVLAVMRRLLPAGLAWFVAAWWVIMPINFDSLYEVHLFAVLPVLVCWLLFLNRPGKWSRGAAMGVLVASIFLIRNEIMIAAAILGVACLVFEWRTHRQQKLRPLAIAWRVLPAYVVPTLIAALITSFFYSRSTCKMPELANSYRSKQALIVGQLYAYRYQQRHPEWNGNPCMKYRELMQSTFGNPDMSLGGALRANPKAMIRQFTWNAQLVPNGLQVLLFNCMSGRVNPDDAAVTIDRPKALGFSLLVCAILAFGFILFLKERRYWWSARLKDRLWGWLAMYAVGTMTCVIMIVATPRPDAMFPLGILLMALTGFYTMVIFSRFFRKWNLALVYPWLSMALICLVPHYYIARNPTGSRPILQTYQNLVPFKDVLSTAPSRVVLSTFSSEMEGYLGLGDGAKALDYYDVVKNNDPEGPSDEQLQAHGVNFIYLDFDHMYEVNGPHLAARLQAAGWEPIGFGSSAESHWVLLQKRQGVPR